MPEFSQKSINYDHARRFLKDMSIDEEVIHILDSLDTEVQEMIAQKLYAVIDNELQIHDVLMFILALYANDKFEDLMAKKFPSSENMPTITLN